MNTDIELGGNRPKVQFINGKNFTKAYNCKKQQAVLMMPILEGLDGVQKMSKSLELYYVTDEAFDMFGKILSISDELMWRYLNFINKIIKRLKK